MRRKPYRPCGEARQLRGTNGWDASGRVRALSYNLSMRLRRKNTRLHRLITRYRLTWAWITLFLYVAAVPFTIIVFPANSLWLGLLVLFSGFTASLTTLADLLVNAEEAEE